MPYVNMVFLIGVATIVLILVFLIIFLLFKIKNGVLASVISVVLILLSLGSWYVLTPAVQSYLKLAEFTTEADEATVLGGGVVLIDSLLTQHEVQKGQLTNYKHLLLKTDSRLDTVQDSLEVERVAREKVIKELAATLAGEYEKEIKDGLVKIEQLENRRVKVSFDEKITFETAEGQLNSRGKEVLSKAAPQMRDWLSANDKLIRIEGHTDRVPIRTDNFSVELGAFCNPGSQHGALSNRRTEPSRKPT